MLAALLERPGQMVTREELRGRLWSADTFVDFDHGLNAAIKRLRDALGESAETPIFIETLARRGYRFIAPVVEDGAPQVEALHRKRLLDRARRILFRSRNRERLTEKGSGRSPSLRRCWSSFLSEYSDVARSAAPAT